jgi:hypothetical protein
MSRVAGASSGAARDTAVGARAYLTAAAAADGSKRTVVDAPATPRARWTARSLGGVLRGRRVLESFIALDPGQERLETGRSARRPCRPAAGPGLRPDDEPYTVALVLSEEPPPSPRGIEARVVRTLEECAVASEVQWKAFGMPPDELAARRAGLRERWDRDWR